MSTQEGILLAVGAVAASELLAASADGRLFSGRSRSANVREILKGSTDPTGTGAGLGPKRDRGGNVDFLGVPDSAIDWLGIVKRRLIAKHGEVEQGRPAVSNAQLRELTTVVLGWRRQIRWPFRVPTFQCTNKWIGDVAQVSECSSAVWQWSTSAACLRKGSDFGDDITDPAARVLVCELVDAFEALDQAHDAVGWLGFADTTPDPSNIDRVFDALVTVALRFDSALDRTGNVTAEAGEQLAKDLEPDKVAQKAGELAGKVGEGVGDLLGGLLESTLGQLALVGALGYLVIKG